MASNPHAPVHHRNLEIVSPICPVSHPCIGRLDRRALNPRAPIQIDWPNLRPAPNISKRVSATLTWWEPQAKRSSRSAWADS